MIEVGKTYKNGEGNNVEIVHIIDKSYPCTWPVLGVVYYKSGSAGSASYTLDGFTLNSPGSFFNLILENEND
jgi:hypothetical protein